jgi:F-type H+-transporting ATPase subunit b
MRLIHARLIQAVAVALLLAPSVAFAAEEPAKSGGMPQLDFANPLTTSQIVWMVIIFAVLYLLLSRWALPQVGEVVEKRAGMIAADLETARQAKAEADAAVEELTVATRKAHADAQSQIAAALAEAKAAAAKQAEEMNRRLEAQLSEAEGRIQAARQSAMGALRQVAAETASSVVARLTGQAPAPEAVDGAVGQALAARSAG